MPARNIIMPEDEDFKHISKSLWHPLISHPGGTDYSLSKARFNVVPAGRRSGKTMRAKRKWVQKAIRFGMERPDIGDGFFIFGAPTYRQAKNIYWHDLKRMIPRNLMATKPLEQALLIRLITGVEIACIGMDNAERHEGRPIDGGVLDEYGNMKADVWPMHIRPALSTPGREGGMDFIGVPEGRNHYYDLYEWACSEEADDWAAFTWTSEVILSPEEIKAAKRDLDPLTYEQEYLASFVTFQGRAYYTFDPEIHTRPGLPYDDRAPLIMFFDFNRSPGVAGVAQEHIIDGVRVSCVIGEVFIPQNSNTVMVCQELLREWGSHKGEVRLYGDASGGARTSGSVAGSDWELIEQAFRPVYGNSLHNMVPRANGPERVRVNSVNSHLKSVDGTVRTLIDPKKAPRLIRDFEGVRTKEDGSIDKSDLGLTHLTDAFGYYVVTEYPINGGTQIHSRFI